jgi:hypothetical protein
MSRGSAWLPILLALLLPASATAQIKLAWQFKKGDRFFVRETTAVQQTIKIMDAETRQELEETRLSRFAVLKTEKDGSVVLDQIIQSVKIKHSGEGPDIDIRVLKQLEGAIFQVTLDSRGQVAKLTGYDELLKKIAKNDPLNTRLVRSLMTDASFKVALASLFGFVPEKAVAKGDSWERKSLLPLGLLGDITLDDHYTLDDLEEAGKIAKVAALSKGAYAPPRKAPGPALKISGGEIRLLKSSGTLHFDAARGRLLSSVVTSRLEGTLQVTVRDAAVTMQFEQDANRNIRVLEKEPGTTPPR